MAEYGYARVSTGDQSTDIQEAALRSAGCNIVRAEKVSGTTMKSREQLRTLLDFMRPGDVLVVTRIDRLARSITDLSAIVSELTKNGCFLRVLEQSFDTSKAEGRLMLSMLGAFAEFETDIRKERQREGILKAKKAGKYTGGKKQKAKIERDNKIKELSDNGMKVSEIALKMSLTRQHIYRVLRKGKRPMV